MSKMIYNALSDIAEVESGKFDIDTLIREDELQSAVWDVESAQGGLCLAEASLKGALSIYDPASPRIAKAIKAVEDARKELTAKKTALAELQREGTTS